MNTALNLAYPIQSSYVPSVARGLYCVVLGALLLLWSAPGNSAPANLSRPNPPSGVLARPASQFGVDNTTSSVSRTLNWDVCALPDDCTLSFDYLVDSEPHYDRLQVWLDSEPAPRVVVSGSDSRHKIIKGIPSGTHTVRFEYVKDSSISRGGDIAWVDNIRAADTNGRHYFDTCRDVWSTPTAPWEWTGAGHGGGWVVVEPPPERAIQRPREQYHQPSSFSWLKKLIYVPTGTARLRFDYYVDSEPKDYLFVVVNGHLAHAISGTEQSGTADVVLPTGSNTVAFAYQKDASGDAGLDLASIDNVRLLNGGLPQSLTDFRGSLPFSDWIPGWSSGSSFGPKGWQIRVKAPHITQIDPNHSVLKPVIDGEVISGKEYSGRATGVSLFRYQRRPVSNIPLVGPQFDDSTKFILAGSDTHRALYLVLMEEASTPQAGNESGDIYLYFDQNRSSSLAHVGCAKGALLPSKEDRKILVSYSIGKGSRSSPASITQWKGTCLKSSPWAVTSAKEEWPIEAVASELSDEGIVTVEMKVVVSKHKLSTAPLGFGLTTRTPKHSRPLRAPYRNVHFPYVNGGAPHDADVLTWETLVFAPWQRSDALTDGCCGPGLI